MRDKLWSFYSLDETVATSIWQEGLVVLDANVLLNFYRYRVATRDELFSLLGTVAERLRVPYQAALEYQRRRLDVMWDMRRPYNELRNLIDKSRGEMLGRVQQLPLRLHPALDVDDLERVVADSFRRIATYLEEKERELPELSGMDLLTGDSIRDQLDALLQNRVGVPFEEERLREIHLQGSSRYEMRVPPGFRDLDKPEPDRYGDLTLWFQIIELAESEDADILFITDDRKDDWWWIVRGERLGARRELAEELRAETGKHLLLYTPDRFMASARQRLGVAVTDDAVREVEEASQTVTESVKCPHCGWSPVTFAIGRQAGASAIPRCPDCQFRFHAHRRGSGEIITTKGGLGRRVIVECPECRNSIPLDFTEREGPKERVCLDCYSLLRIESDGSAELIGFMTVVDTVAKDERHLRCPRCERDHVTFAAHKGNTYALCDSQPPALLLRGSIGDG